MVLFIGLYGCKNIRKKKTNEAEKEELLNSIRENDAMEEPGLNIDNVTDPGERIIIYSYEEIIKTQNKKNEKICCKTRTDVEEA